MRSGRGQATVEYVALAAIVALILLGAVAITPGGLGTRIVHTIRLGICRVSGTTCPSSPRDRADLAPCPLSRATRSEDLGVSVAVVKLGQGLELVRETYSDGTVVVRFSDEQEAGLTAALGPRFKLGRVEGGATAGVSVTFNSGRAWRFPDAAAARRFVDEYGGLQTIKGRVVDDLKRDCLLCRAVGLGPKTPPPPTESYEQFGARGSLDVTLGIKHLDGLASAIEGSGSEGSGSAAIGLRHGPAGRRTVYFRLDASSSLGLFTAAGIQPVVGASGTVGLTLDRRDRPVSLRFDGAAVGGDGARGRAYELDMEVPARSPAVRAHLRGVLRALAPAHVGDLPVAVADAVGWVRDNAPINRREYAITGAHGGFGAEIGLGAKLGGSYGHGDRRLRLLDAQTRLPGLPFLPRADCLESRRTARATSSARSWLPGRRVT